MNFFAFRFIWFRNIALNRVLFAGLSLAALMAQETGKAVVPAGLENVDGEATAFFQSGHYQQLIVSGAMALPQTAVWLTEMAFRLNAGTSSTGNDVVAHYTKLDISLSTNPRQGPPRSFYEEGGDRLLVYSSSEPIIVPAPVFPGPNPFLVRFPFSQPFLYHPGRALLIDFDVSAINKLDLDFTVSPTLRFLSELRPGDVRTSASGYVVQFSYAVPEPTFSVIAGLSGFIALALRKLILCYPLS